MAQGRKRRVIRYYLFLAVRSLRREITFTTLMIGCIGLGVASTMTTFTVLHVLTGDPIPARSAVLYSPHINPVPITYQVSAEAPDPADNLTWPDAQALVSARLGAHQAMMAGATSVVRGPTSKARPFYANGRLTTSDFFAMFGVPFVKGHAWGSLEDESHDRVVVLSQSLARKLIDGVDVKDRPQVEIGGRMFTVIGITKDWAPRPLFYADASAKSYGDEDSFFLPLTAGMDASISINSNVSTWAGPNTLPAMLTSGSTSWLQVWVDLETPKQKAAYERFLDNYVSEQRNLGRISRPLSETRLYSLMSYLRHLNLVPEDARVQFFVALGFLVVCIANACGLLLARFLRRRGEISVRRSMGASKASIFIQFGTEAAFLGLLGGGVGLAGALGGLHFVRSGTTDYAQLIHMDASMLALTLVVAVVATILAGLFPAWCACQVQPALQMKCL